jgi:DHA2 family multidrug resistance protein
VDSEVQQEQNWKPRVNPWVIAATVALAAFMEVLDTSIANVALPHISGDLGASTDEGTWVLTSYLVSNAVILPIGAWASTVIGRKKFFMLCIGIFTVASFACGLAPSLGFLLFARVIQGIGGGGLQPVAQAIMADSFEPSKRGQAFALYGVVAVVAPSIGPTIGGLITDSFSWRWIFFINIPVGVLAIFLVMHLVDDPPWIKPVLANFKNLDYIGLGFLAIAMGGMQIMLDKGVEDDWFASTLVRIMATLFVVGGIGFIVTELRVRTPIMDLSLFRFKNFAICVGLMILVGGLLTASTVLQPQYLQQVLGYTATDAGEALTLGGVALLFMMPFAGAATNIFSARTLGLVGFVGFVGAYYYTSTHITLQMSFGFASWLRILQMLPIPFCFIAITTAAYVGLPKEDSNQVSGIINFVRNIGGSVLIAVTGAIITYRADFHQQRLNTPLNPSNPAFNKHVDALASAYGKVVSPATATHTAHTQIYKQLGTQAQVQGYEDVYRVLCWMAFLMIFAALLLSKNKPGEGAPEGAGV